MAWCGAANAEIAARTPGRFTLIQDAAMAVEFYRRLLATGWRRAEIEMLRGKSLACWCPPGSPCHADVLLELANR